MNVTPFSHVVDNPDRDSFLAMLRSYGPSVPRKLLTRLIDLFDDLRHLISTVNFFIYVYLRS